MLELEIKLTAPAGMPGGPEALLERLRHAPDLAGYQLGPGRLLSIHDVYFDTAERTLGRHRAALRLRRANGQARVTFKAAESWASGGLVRREEYEADLDGAALTAALAALVDRGLLSPAAAGEVTLDGFAAGVATGPLRPVLATASQRWERLVHRPGGLAVGQLVLDRVTYTGLPLPPFFDIEVEVLGAGDETDLAALREGLQAAAGGALLPASESKLARGLRLLSASGPAAAPGKRLSLPDTKPNGGRGTRPGISSRE